MKSKQPKVGFINKVNQVLNANDAIKDLGERAISKNNAIAVAGQGTYIAMVGYHENGKQLFAELSTEKRFLKFGLAMMIMNYSIDNFMSSELKTIAKTLMWTGLLLTASNDGHVFDKITEYFKCGK